MASASPASPSDRREVPGHGPHPGVGGDLGRGSGEVGETSSSTAAGGAPPTATGPASSRLASSVPMNPAPPVTMTRMLTTTS